MKITLAEAFMLRNDIKKDIKKLTEAANQNQWEEKSLPFDFKKGTKKNPADAYKEALEKMSTLQTLNENITAVNLTNNKLLRENETITAKIAFMEEVFEHLRRFPGEKSRNPFYDSNKGDSIQFYEYILLLDPNSVSAELEAAKLRKRAIEKELYHNNFTLTLEI